MRALSLAVTLVALLVSAPTDGAAQTDLSGDWFFTVRGHGLPSSRDNLPFVVLHLVTVVQDGQTLTMTQARDGGSQIEMSGSIDETDVVSLSWENIVRRGVDIRMTGTVMEDFMSGTIEYDGGEGSWEAERAEPRS